MDTRALDHFALDHHGLVTKRRRSDWASSTATWYRALSDGRFDVIHPGVARMAGAPTTPRAGHRRRRPRTRPSVASHRSAARLWGIPRPAADPVEVILTRRTRTPDLDGVIVHRPRDLKDLTPVRRASIPTTNVLRLLRLGAVDPAAVRRAVGHVVTAAWWRRRSPLPRRIDRHSRRGRHGVPAFRDALEEWVIDGKPVDSVARAGHAPALRCATGSRPVEFHPPHRPVSRSTFASSARRSCSSATAGSSTPRRRRSKHAMPPATLTSPSTDTSRCASPTTRSCASHAKQARRIRAIIDRWAARTGRGSVRRSENPRPVTDENVRAQMSGARRVTSGACGCRRRRGWSRR